MNDFLTRPLTDPIRSRMATSNHAYGCAIQVFKRTTRRIPERVLNVLAAVLVGMAFGVLLAWRG